MLPSGKSTPTTTPGVCPVSTIGRTNESTLDWRVPPRVCRAVAISSALRSVVDSVPQPATSNQTQDPKIVSNAWQRWLGRHGFSRTNKSFSPPRKIQVPTQDPLELARCCDSAADAESRLSSIVAASTRASLREDHANPG